MLVEFSALKWNLLILLIFPVFINVERYTKQFYITKENNIFKTFRYFLCYNLTGIFLLISIYRNRHIKSSKSNKNANDKSMDESNEQTESTNIVDKIERKKERILKIKAFLFLMGLSALAMICYLYRCYLEKTEYKYAKPSVGIFFNIIDLTVLSHFIINQKIHKHHFISLGIFTVSLIVIFIISFPYMTEIWQSFLYLFFYSLLFCLYDVLKKKYMNVFYKSPYYMMFFIGLMNSILLLIYELFVYYLYPDISGIVIGFQNNINSAGDFFIFILDAILQCICYLGLWLVIYYFTPSHCLISENISEYINYITTVFNNNDEYYSIHNIIIYSICNLLNFIGFLVFTEVIILNFCGLDFNTIKRILFRERNDSVDILKEINGMEDMSSSESSELFTE